MSIYKKSWKQRTWLLLFLLLLRLPLLVFNFQELLLDYSEEDQAKQFFVIAIVLNSI